METFLFSNLQCWHTLFFITHPHVLVAVSTILKSYGSVYLTTTPTGWIRSCHSFPALSVRVFLAASPYCQLLLFWHRHPSTQYKPLFTLCSLLHQTFFNDFSLCYHFAAALNSLPSHGVCMEPQNWALWLFPHLHFLSLSLCAPFSPHCYPVCSMLSLNTVTTIV